jgi:hypothetical protein
VARPRRTQEQRSATAAFVNRLVALSPVESNVDFAELTGLPESNVSEYRSGNSVPDGYTLLTMMQATIADELAAIGAAVDPSVLPDPLVPRRELQAAVDELMDWQPDAIAKLLELETRLERLESAPASQRKKSAGQRR